MFSPRTSPAFLSPPLPSSLSSSSLSKLDAILHAGSAGTKLDIGAGGTDIGVVKRSRGMCARVEQGIGGMVEGVE
jgi:hypothetical protein